MAGLLSFLRKKPDNLLCVDFVCRGVPSPGLWDNYVKYMENKYSSKIVGARFKHKTYGYHTSTMKIDFANGKTYYGSGRVDPYMKAFVREISSRPSCAACAFKGIERPTPMPHISVPLVNWQLDQGLFRFMLDYRGNKEEQGKLFSTLLLSSTIQSIIYSIFFVCAEPFLKIQNAYFLLLYVVLQVYTALFLQFVRGLGYSVKYTIASFISASATTVLNVIALAILKMGLQWLV